MLLICFKKIEQNLTDLRKEKVKTGAAHPHNYPGMTLFFSVQSSNY